MSRMIRKQVYIEKRQEQILKRLAHDRGVTQAEVVREAIDRAESPRQPSRRLPDPEAIREFLTFVRAIASRPRRPVTRPRWTRESLYEDRIGRWTKS